MSGPVVTQVHLGWATSAAQHLCNEADHPAAVSLLADAFARFEAEIRTAAQAAAKEREDALVEALEGLIASLTKGSGSVMTCALMHEHWALRQARATLARHKAGQP